MLKILFRTHGGTATGLGHIMRCVSLAQAFRAKDRGAEVECSFIVNSEISGLVHTVGFRYRCSETFDTTEKSIFEEFSPDWILFDAYGAPCEYLDFLKSVTRKLAIIDDNNDQYASKNVDLVINGNIHAEQLLYSEHFPNAKFLVGLSYLLMKPEYWKESTHFRSKRDSVLITTGGSDFFNILEKMASSLRCIPEKKTLVVGRAFLPSQIRAIQEKFTQGYEILLFPESLKNAIHQSSIVCTASGSTVYEVLRLKRVPILFQTAENQRKIAEFLKKLGVPDLGWQGSIVWENAQQRIKKILTHYSDYEKHLSSLFSKFDGNGVFRVVDEIAKAS